MASDDAAEAQKAQKIAVETEKTSRSIKSLMSEILDTKKLITDDDIKRAKITRDLANIMKTSYGTAKQLLSIKEKEKSLATQLQDTQRQAAIDGSEQVKNAQSLLDKYNKRIEREKKIDEWTGKWKDKWDEFWEIAQDPKIAQGLFLIALTAEAKKFAGSLTDMADNMGMTVQQSMELGPSMLSAGISGALFGVSMKESAAAMAGLAEGAGSLKGLSGDAAVETAKLAFNIGLSEQETGKLLARNMLLTGETLEQSKASLQTVANLARGAKLPIGKVMKDVANNMDMMAKFGNKTVEELGKAAVEAQKMGATLSDIAGFGEAMMDVDNARNKAMQLSVLLGRSINVEKVQALIYAGKETEGYQEMLKQLGGIQGFNKMDYFARRDAAAMMGISVGELQKQMNLAAGLSETGEKQASKQSEIAALATKIGGYWKENGAFMAAALNATASLQQLNVIGWAKQKLHWIKEKGHMLWKKAFGGGAAQALAKGPMKADGSPDMRFKANKGAKGLVGKIQKPLDSGNKLSGKMDKIPAKKGNVISRFFNSFKKVNWSSILKAVVAMTLMGVSLLAFVPGFSALATVPVSGILAGIGTLFAMTLAMKFMGKATSSILKGSAGLLIMGAALIPAAYAFQMIAEVPAGAMFAFAGALSVLGVVFALLGMLGTLPVGAAGLLIMAIAMIPAALAFQMIAGIPMGEIWNFAAVLSVLGIVFSLLGMLGTLPIGALGLLLMAPAMIIAAVAFQMVAGLPMGEMWNFAAVLSVLGLAFAGIGFLPTIFVGALGLLVMAPAMILAAVAFQMIAGVPMDAMLGFAGALIALGLAFALIGFLPTIFVGALGLLMLSAAMIPAAVAFQMIAGVPVDQMMGFAKVLTVLGLAFAALGFLSPFIIAGAFAMTVASGGLILFGTAMGMIPQDLMQGEQMLSMAMGMAAMGIAGVAMLLGAPGFFAMSAGLFAFGAALMIIQPLLPVVEKLASLGLIGDMGGAESTAGGGGGGGDEDNLVVQKLDELITLISAGGKVVMDGKEVGKVIQMANGPMGS